MLTIHIDGGARGNPGPAGYGAFVTDAAGNVLAELHGGLGIATNNVAEYNGLLAALQWAVEHGHRVVRIKADSELLVKQMRGEYKIKNAGLQPLAARARVLIGQLDRVTFEHVRRELPEDRKAIDIGDYYADDTKLRTTLGWAPEVGLEQGLGATLDYYRAHGARYFGDA